jgi:hypothetical protein
MKVMVKDRMVVKTADFERICTAPEGLQLEIDKLVSKISKGRSFVRYIMHVQLYNNIMVCRHSLLTTIGPLEQRM